MDTVDPRQAEARRLFHDEGLRKAEIARRLAVNVNTVQTWLPSDSVLTDHARRRRAAALRARGATNVEIGTELGISRQRVAQLLGPVAAPSMGPADRVTVNLPRATAEAMRRRAKALGLRSYRGARSGEGSIARLLEAIRTGELELRRRGGAVAPGQDDEVTDG